MDNVRRVVTQGTTVEGKPSLVFPREAPRTPAEFLTTATQLTQLGFTASDVQTFVSRLIEYLVTSPERRASELQNLSAYDFFVGRAAHTDPPRYSYSPRFDAILLEMPRVLAGSTRAGAMPAQTSPPIFSSSCKWTAATTKPTEYSTVPPRNRGWTTGTATSSSLGSVSCTAGPPSPTRPPSTRSNRPTSDPGCR